MTISYGLCWNIDSRKIIWPPRAHFGSENESLKGLSKVLHNGFPDIMDCKRRQLVLVIAFILLNYNN